MLGDWLVVPSCGLKALLKDTNKQVRRQRHQPDLEDSAEYGRYLRGGGSEQKKMGGGEGSPCCLSAEPWRDLSPGVNCHQPKVEQNSSPKMDTHNAC